MTEKICFNLTDVCVVNIKESKNDDESPIVTTVPVKPLAEYVGSETPQKMHGLWTIPANILEKERERLPHVVAHVAAREIQYQVLYKETPFNVYLDATAELETKLNGDAELYAVAEFIIEEEKDNA